MFSECLSHLDLKRVLGEYRPYPRLFDRSAWEGLDENSKRDLIAWGEEALRGYPMLSATRFMAFKRTGDRVGFETPYFARRRLLIGATLAYCLTLEDKFLDAVIDGLWCVCEETSWVISAHNGGDRPGVANMHLLPDDEDPNIDLFAAQTAATLADVLYLLEAPLSQVSPLIPRRVRREVTRRVLTPFRVRDDYWWMGVTRSDLNNWTPWILSNVLEALLIVERDPDLRAEGVARGLVMLDRYAACLPEDGGCDEGVGYFNMAGLSLLDCLESLYLASGGALDFYREPLLRALAAFPLHMHLSGGMFVNYADCDAYPLLDGERVWRFGQRVGNEALMALGSVLRRNRDTVRPMDTPQMNRCLLSLFASLPVQPMPARPAFDALPNLQVYSWRIGSMILSAKGGHNAENHNHNDVGHFILTKGGEAVILDPGNCVYTATTFSPDRYTLMNTRARNHNIPLIGGFEQAPGISHRAEDVHADEKGMSLDIASAYPDEAGVMQAERRFSVLDAAIALEDDIILRRAGEVTWVFMLRREPKLKEGLAELGGVTMTFDPALKAMAEEMPVTDARMARNWPGSLWRLTLTASAAPEHHQTFQWSETDIP